MRKQSEEASTLLQEEWSPRSMTSRDSRRRKRGSPNLETEQSFGEELGHAAAETYLLTTLTFTLLRYLGLGYRWLTRFTALALYATFLMPGFLQVSYYYFFSSQVRRSVIYGDKPRNRLDLYIPTNTNEPKPVVAFVTGGAWIIGYKAWGALLGMQLVERDIIVACIDYRNFPQGTIGDMVEDTSTAITFIMKNIADYGGDPNRLYLMGQSAGAHIAACALVEQAVKERANPESVTWSVSMIRYFFGLSGGYNLCKLVDHFHSRGLYRSLFLSVMEGEESLRKFSPELRVQEPGNREVARTLPRVALFHGTEDSSIPSDSSKAFVEGIEKAGGEAQLVLFEGKTHTDLFLQDPLRGGRDAMVEHLVSIIHAGDRDALARDAAALPRRRFVPELLLRFARNVSPF